MRTEKAHILEFRPTIKSLCDAEESDLNSFRAGKGYELFDEYLRNDAAIDQISGKGVTHLVYDECREQIVAYFTLSVGVIPYDDGHIEDDERSTLSNYPYISVIEIKMFAVSEKYQDVFFESEGEDIPIAAWCLRYIIQYIDNLVTNDIGAQAVYLHAVDSAEKFYETNSFRYVEEKMQPLYSTDDNLRAMWMPLRDIPEYKD